MRCDAMASAAKCWDLEHPGLDVLVQLVAEANHDAGRVLRAVLLQVLRGLHLRTCREARRFLMEM